MRKKLFFGSISLVGFLIVLLISKSNFSFTKTIPFDNSDIFSEKFLGVLNNETNRIAIISGAGPAGLTSALTLQKSGFFTHIIIFEKREEYTRINEVILQVNSLPWLKNLNIADEIIEASLFFPKFSFIINDLKKETNTMMHTNTTDIPSIDYSMPAKQIFGGDLNVTYSIPIWKMQALLTQKIREFNNIHLVPGNIELNNCDLGKCQVFVKPKNAKSFNLPRADLIVIAEGAHSDNRARMGINVAKSDRPDEKICIGLVSAEGIIQNNFEAHFSVVVDAPNDNCTASFNPFEHEVFVVGHMHEEESGEECVKRVTCSALKSQPEISLQLPLDIQNIMVKQDSIHVFDLQFNYSANRGLADNAILIGDAFANGSPIGALGMSMAVSIEQYYLQTLVEFMQNDPSNNQNHLDNYYKKMLDLSHFWHNHVRIDVH